MGTGQVLQVLQILIDDHRKEWLKERLLSLNESVDKNLALNESLVEEACECVLNLDRVSISFLMQKLKCSESIAKEVKERIGTLHNENYRTLDEK